MKFHYQPRSIARLLKMDGIEVRTVAEPTEDTDGDIELTAGLSVQVDTDALGLMRQIGEGDDATFEHYGFFDKYPDLVRAIRGALAEVKA